MHHCVTDHETHLGILVAVIGACAALSGLLVRWQVRPQASEEYEELLVQHPGAGEWQGVKAYVKGRWRFLVVLMIILVVIESQSIPWPAYLIVGVLAVPFTLADWAVQAKARADLAGKPLEQEWRDVWVVMTRGWPYLIAAGVVVAVAAALWTLSGSTC